MRPKGIGRRRAPVLTASAAAASVMLTGCALLGDLGAPTVGVTAPGNFSILAQSPSEISGVALGQIASVTVAIDGRSAGRPQAGATETEWRLPLTHSLEKGVHWVRAIATGAAGFASADAVFAISSVPFAIAFAPARMVVDRSVANAQPLSVQLGLLGPGFGDGYDVRLALENAGGLTFDVFPPDAMESTRNFHPSPIEPVSTGQWVSVDIAITPDTPTGEHQLVIRADGPPGTDPQRATFTVEVVDGAAPSQSSSGPSRRTPRPAAPGG